MSAISHINKFLRQHAISVFIFFVSINSITAQEYKTNTDSVLKIAEAYLNYFPDSTIYFLNTINYKSIKTIPEQDLNFLKLKSQAFYNLSEIDSAYSYAIYLKEQSQKSKLADYEIESYRLISLIYRSKGNYELSQKYCRTGIEKCDSLNIIDKKAALLNNLGVLYGESGDFENCLSNHLKSITIYQNLKDTFGMMAGYNNIGLLYNKLKDNDKAKEYYFKGIGLANKINSPIYKARVYANLGIVYAESKEFNKAFDYFNIALNLFKLTESEYEIGLTYESIAETYVLSENYLKAEFYYLASIQILSNIGTLSDQVELNLNLAEVLILNKKSHAALKYLQKTDSLLVSKSQKDTYIHYYEIYGLYFEAVQNFKKALEYQKQYANLKESLFHSELDNEIAKQKVKFDYYTQQKELKRLQAVSELDRENSEKQKRIIRLYIIGVITILIIGLISFIIIRREFNINKMTTKLLKQNRTVLLEKNYEVTRQNEEIKSQSEQLYLINEDLLQLKTAVDETDHAVTILDKEGNFLWGNKGFDRLYDINFEDFIKKYPNILDASKKSSNHEQMSRVINKCITEKTSGSYEFSTVNRKGENIWIQTGIKAVTDISGNIISLIVIDTDISEKVKTGRILEQKNYELEKQKEDIESSLRYAQTIQKAILPVPLSMRKNNDFFLIYMPKDIVSGDFYWFSAQEDSPYTFFAVVDCTGHGVPGAFMSMIGARLLNYIVNEKNFSDPAQILHEMHESVKIALKQNLSGNRDGMDISLCRIEKDIKHEKEVVFSGAKQSIYYFKQEEKILEKIKGDVKSIGGHYYENINFTNKQFFLKKNDVLYLFTDGYIDQDSQEGKKIGSPGLSQLLNKIGVLHLKQQKEILLKYFKDHKGNINQRDDITFLGIKIE